MEVLNKTHKHPSPITEEAIKAHLPIAKGVGAVPRGKAFGFCQGFLEDFILLTE